MAVREEKITLEPMDVTWGLREKITIATVADVAGSLGGQSFNISSAEDVILYYVWFNTGASGDPAPAGRTGIEVTIDNDDDADIVASKMQVVLEAIEDFNTKVVANLVTIENIALGTTTLAVDVDTTFTIVSVTVGDGRDLGGTGPIEVTFATDLSDITAAQTGTQILDQVMTASNMDLSFELLELTQENWELLLGGVIGDTKTVGPDTLVGLGESKRFKNMSQFARELVLKPVGSLDDKRNLHIWKTYPIIDNASYAGDDISKMSTAWKALRDIKKDSKINLMVFGNGRANLLL